jgi:hypothetical protein
MISNKGINKKLNRIIIKILSNENLRDKEIDKIFLLKKQILIFLKNKKILKIYLGKNLDLILISSLPKKLRVFKNILALCPLRFKDFLLFPDFLSFGLFLKNNNYPDKKRLIIKKIKK